MGQALTAFELREVPQGAHGRVQTNPPHSSEEDHTSFEVGWSAAHTNGDVPTRQLPLR